MSVCLPFQDRVAKEIREFLEHDTWKIIFLSGQWGSGKTFLLKTHFVDEPDCIYVSLYGARSVEELRARVAATWLAKSGSRGPEKASARRSLWRRIRFWCKSKFLVGSSTAQQLTEAGSIEVPESYHSLATVGLWVLLNSGKIRTVILDDLERKHKELDLGELFGFADFVSEKSGARIILVGNLEKLEGRDDNTIRGEIGLEKTVSHEIRLEPDLESICSITVSGFDLDQSVKDAVKNFCSVTGIDNIRLLRRTVEHINRFLTSVAGTDVTALVDESEVSKLYLCLIFSRFSDGFGLDWPAAKALADVAVFPEFVHSESKRAKEALSFAQAIGFPDLAYPELIVQHVSTGILDKNRVISRLLELKNAPANQPSIHSSGLWNEIWRVYGASFSDNQDAIRDSIRTFLEAEAHLLDLKRYKSLKSLAESVELDISGYEQEAHMASVRNVSTFFQQIGAFFYVTTSGSSVLTGVGTLSKLSGSSRTCSAG